MKTFEEIEAAIAEKEAQRELKQQELEAAEADMKAADEAADRKAYEKAAGAQWVAERKVAKAQRELDAFADTNTDQLIDIDSSLTDLAWTVNEEAAAYREKLYKEICEKLEEYKDIENKVNALYSRLGVLQRKDVKDYGHLEITSRYRLGTAARELEQLSPGAAFASAYAEVVPQRVNGSGQPVEPGRLAMPGQY